MHEKRNLFIVILLVFFIIWAFLGWFVFNPEESSHLIHRWIPSLVVIGLGVVAWYVLTVEDKLPDDLAQKVGPVYYDVDGLAFMPTVRVRESGQAELSLYYQNRFENYTQAVVHLRPPEDSFIIRPGTRDLHFVFKADGGEFGVIHQPIAVPRHLAGAVIDVQLAAVARFPRSHGTRLRSNEGMRCGTFVVDWGQAFKVGVHEVSGEIELSNPVTLHLSLPTVANPKIVGPDVWKQEQLRAGPREGAVLG